MSALEWIKADPDNPPEHTPLLVSCPLFDSKTGERLGGGLYVVYEIADNYILCDAYWRNIGLTWLDVEKYLEITE